MKPVDAPVTQPFGANPTRNRPHPIYGDYQPYGHLGIDYGAPLGTPVRAVADGVIGFADWGQKMGPNPWLMIPYSPDSGICVIIDHGPYSTLSAHLSATHRNAGERVKAGDIIGHTGSTGRSGGPHLHFEVITRNPPNDPTRMYGRVNPEPYLGGLTPQAETITVQEDPMPTLSDIATTLRNVLHEDRQKNLFRSLVGSAPIKQADGTYRPLAAVLQTITFRLQRTDANVIELKARLAAVTDAVADLQEDPAQALAKIHAAAEAGTAAALADAQKIDAELIAAAVVDEQAERLTKGA